MPQTVAGVVLPDPMHLEGWDEQDEPLASDPHSDEQTYCFTALRYLLNPDGHYVSMDRWLRMDPADEQDKLLPDLLIARDVLHQQWGVDEYLPWVVGKPPEVLAEFLSPHSEAADKIHKPRRYGKLGVREYFLFDPKGSFGVPRIQGWALFGEEDRQALPRDSDGGVASRMLPVRFVQMDGHIGVVDTRTRELALRYEEAQRLLREEMEARHRAEQAQQQADEARQRAEEARRQEAAARQRAEKAQQQTEVARQQEAAARVEAQAEAARLRAEVDRLRRVNQKDEGG